MNQRLSRRAAAGLLAVALMGAPWLIAQQPDLSDSHTYTVKVLPGLGGLAGAISINDLGWASGLSEPKNNAYDRAFLWRNGKATNLGTLGGHNSSVSFPNKNRIGWIAGGSETKDDDPYQENFCQFLCAGNKCLPFNRICRGFLWRSEIDRMIELPPLPGGDNSEAAGANNRRQIVGFAENGVQDSNCAAPQVFDYFGVVWALDSDGVPYISQQLDPLAGDAIAAGTAINDRGDVAGGSGPCGSPGLGSAAHALLWHKGNVIDLGTLGGAISNLAFALNNHGQVVGISDLPGDSVAHPFLWQSGTMEDLGALRTDDTFALATSINDSGDVVGFSCGPVDCRGFLWKNGRMMDVNSFLPQNSPLLIQDAADINACGEIAIQALDQTTGEDVAAILIPNECLDVER
jgi:probable HAF family extracellular repeat protein